jgi:hypothetical protein
MIFGMISFYRNHGNEKKVLNELQKNMKFGEHDAGNWRYLMKLDMAIHLRFVAFITHELLSFPIPIFERL